jgi:hypothetical protein
MLSNDSKNAVTLGEFLLRGDIFDPAEVFLVERKTRCEADERLMTFHSPERLNVVLLNKFPVRLAGGHIHF